MSSGGQLILDYGCSRVIHCRGWFDGVLLGLFAARDIIIPAIQFILKMTDLLPQLFIVSPQVQVIMGPLICTMAF
jgi:hypothetical protein